MLHAAWCYVLRTQHFSTISYTSVSTVSTFHIHGFTVKRATCFVWDSSSGILHENVTTIKLPNLNQIALYFVWPWFLMMWQEYHVFGSTRGGESSEEGKEENTEKVRLYYNHIPAEYLGTLVRKSSTFTKLRHQGNPCSHHLWCIYLWKNRHHT